MKMDVQCQRKFKQIGETLRIFEKTIENVRQIITKVERFLEEI